MNLMLKKTLKMPIRTLTASLIACSLFSFAYAQSNVVNNPIASNADLHRQDAIQKITTVTSTIDKPIVAPVYKSNQPNRITTTLKQPTDTARSFRWFTSDAAKMPIVLISTQSDMKNAKTYQAQISTVESHYLERDKDGFFIYKVVDTRCI